MYPMTMYLTEEGQPLDKGWQGRNFGVRNPEYYDVPIKVSKRVMRIISKHLRAHKVKTAVALSDDAKEGLYAELTVYLHRVDRPASLFDTAMTWLHRLIKF